MVKILIAGGAGYLGQTIIKYLNLEVGVEYHVLTRSHRENHGNVHYHLWDGKTIGPWRVYLDMCDVLVNLAGKSVKCRYNEANRNEIYNSRIDSTYILGEAVARAAKPPSLWINASTATIYRHETERANDEHNGILGSGFSVDVAKKWEETFFAAYTPFTRKVNLRTAIVFGREAEVFDIYKQHTKMHLSGRHGDGNQMVSWIHELDLVAAIRHMIIREESDGTYNIAAPYAVADEQFLASFRQLMRKPFGLPIPEWALEIGALYCGAETEMLLKSRWVYPARLLEEGFDFRYPHVDDALSELISGGTRGVGMMETI